jgi:multidrug efflux pump subunit AcrA (membrane-fusion protein)
VHGKVSGYIRRIYVDIGDRVHEAQTLAVLEVPELDAEVAGAQAGITQTQQNIERLQNGSHGRRRTTPPRMQTMFA